MIALILVLILGVIMGWIMHREYVRQMWRIGSSFRRRAKGIYGRRNGGR